jgi:23S rRNA (uracil1939-C5)-methyltransferase
MNTALHEIRLEKLTYGGDALGHLEDGRAVFVPFGLPGEKVRVGLTEEKRGHARGTLVEVLESHPQRIPPRCRHFGTCGGCHFQNLSYPAQLEAKAAILKDCLAHIGRIDPSALHAVVPSQSAWNYRNHVQFHLTPQGRLGYIGGPNERGVIPISECHLPEPPINALWPALQLEDGLGLERVSLRCGLEEDLMLILESGEVPELELEAGISVVHLKGSETLVMAGEDHLLQRVRDRDFQVSAASFFQVNTPMACRMVEHLQERLSAGTGTVLVDAYCGVGLFSAFFASRVGRVVGIEASPAACDDFMVNLDEFENVELYQAPVEEALPRLAIQPTVVIVDPPRAGLGKIVLDALVGLMPAQIVYVSCDPPTLARDTARLIAGGYQLREVTLFDLFPQTYHIESISILDRV